MATECVYNTSCQLSSNLTFFFFFVVSSKLWKGTIPPPVYTPTNPDLMCVHHNPYIAVASQLPYDHHTGQFLPLHLFRDAVLSARWT